MKTCIILLLGLTFFCKNTNAQSFEWAKRAGSYAFDLGYAIGTDNAGNVYISGKYELNANFGGTIVPCAGNHDIYLAKYNSAGVFQWVRTAGGIIGDYTHAMCVDAAGNSYITGEFEKTTKFVGTSVSLVSHGNNDIFVAKYNTNGVMQWAKSLGGGGASDRGLGITVSNEGVFVTGNFTGTGYFPGTTVSSSGGLDILLAKYTTDGVFQWIKKAGGSGDDEGFAISNDLSGNLYVTGYFNGSANFNSTVVKSAGGTDIFLAKYNSSGGLIWVKKMGAGANDAGNGIKVDNAGRVFITGGFRYTTYFGSIQLKASGGNADMFIACYDGSGNAIWAKRAGGSLNDVGRAVAVDASSNTFITGNFGKTATFGSITLNGVDSTELFFASYDVAGNFRWVLKAGGDVDASDPGRFIEMGLSIATDPSGNVFASGTFRSNSTFGSTTLSAYNNHTDIFLTKIRPGRIFGNPLNAKIMPSGTASYCSGGTVLLKTIEDTANLYIWKKDDVVIKESTDAFYRANSPGRYSVIIINGKDSTMSESTVVTESKSIVASIITSGNIFCKDSNNVLRANTGDEYIYQWKRNGVAIPGATASFYKPERSGDYQVKIIQGSCFDWSGNLKIEVRSCQESDSASDITSNNIEDITTNSLQPKADSLLVKIYPNPNNGLFTLEINMVHPNGQAEPVKVELVNAMGQVVYFKFLSCNNGCINEHIELESTVSTGIYFLQVTIGDKVEKTQMMLCR